MLWQISNIIHPVHILKYCNSPILPMYLYRLLTTSVDNKAGIIVILFHFFMN